MKKCAVCKASVTREDAPVLMAGGYGGPRFLCDECSAALDEATTSRDCDRIAAAMDSLGKKMSESDPDSKTFEAVSEILYSASERAKKIRDGSYDFSLDEASEWLDDIPEELKETEEDRELDRRDAEREKQFDSFFKWVALGAIIGAVGFVIWKLIESYLI